MADNDKKDTPALRRMHHVMPFAIALFLTVGGCSHSPPDLSRVLGQTPEEVRDYLGDPKSSDPESENYEFNVGGRTVMLGVIYRGGSAVVAVTLGALGTPKWTEQQFKDWLGSNCTVEIESESARLGLTPPPGVEAGFSATVRPPCTPRVY